MELVLTLITVVIALVGMIGTIIVRDRQIIRMIHDGDRNNSTALQSATNGIHERINRFKDAHISDMNDARDSNQVNFVNKEHFGACMDGLQRSMDSVNKKLDRIMEGHTNGG